MSIDRARVQPTGRLCVTFKLQAGDGFSGGLLPRENLQWPQDTLLERGRPRRRTFARSDSKL